MEKARAGRQVRRGLFALQISHDEPRNIRAAATMMNPIEAAGACVTRFEEAERITGFAQTLN